MNSFTVTGNLTADPSVKMTQGGSKMCTLRIANNQGFGDNKRTDFFHAIAFGKRAEYCENWLKKGTKVLVRGSVRTGSYDNKDGVKIPTFDIWIDEIEKLTFDNNGGKASAHKQEEVPAGFEAADMDVPF